MTEEMYTQINDPKVAETIRKTAKDISDQWTILEGYRDTISEAFKALSEETQVPLRLLRKIVRAYHKQTFETEVQEAGDFEIMYEKIFDKEVD